MQGTLALLAASVARWARMHPGWQREHGDGATAHSDLSNPSLPPFSCPPSPRRVMVMGMGGGQQAPGFLRHRRGHNPMAAWQHGSMARKHGDAVRPRVLARANQPAHLGFWSLIVGGVAGLKAQDQMHGLDPASQPGLATSSSLARSGPPPLTCMQRRPVGLPGSPKHQFSSRFYKCRPAPDPAPATFCRATVVATMAELVPVTAVAPIAAVPPAALSYRERLTQFKILEEKRLELIEVRGCRPANKTRLGLMREHTGAAGEAGKDRSPADADRTRPQLGTKRASNTAG